MEKHELNELVYDELALDWLGVKDSRFDVSDISQSHDVPESAIQESLSWLRNTRRAKGSHYPGTKLHRSPSLTRQGKKLWVSERVHLSFPQYSDYSKRITNFLMGKSQVETEDIAVHLGIPSKDLQFYLKIMLADDVLRLHWMRDDTVYTVSVK